MARLILVVDDEESIRTLVTDALQAKGCKVVHAADGEQAIKLLQTLRPSLVLIDFLLPKKNGFAVAEAIRANPEMQKTPLVMMSGVFKNPKTAVEAREKYQVIEFLAKPIDFDRLYRLISQHAIEVDDSDLGEGAPAGDEELGIMGTFSGPTGSARAESPLQPGSARHPSTTLEDGARIPAVGGMRAGPSMPQSGDLARFPVALLISIARYDRMTGMLDLSDAEGVHRRVYITGGQPIFMQSNAEGENVGALLLRRGRITEPDFDRSLNYMKQQKRTLQQALLELRLATEQDLSTAYKLLAGQLLPTAIGMSSGTFGWRETDAFVGRVPEGKFEPIKVLFDGIKRHVHPPQILRFFSGREDIPLRKTPEFEALLGQFRRSFSASNIAGEIDGKATYRDVTRRHSNDSASVIPQLFALVTSGMTVLPEVDSDNILDAMVNQAAASVAGMADGGLGLEELPPEALHFAEQSGDEEGTPEDKRARAKIGAGHADFMSKNFFEILGVRPSKEINADLLKQNYMGLVKVWHTDRFAGLNLGSMQRKLDDVFQRISEAYETLVDPAKRGEYLVFTDRKSKGLQTNVELVFQAERLFEESVSALRRKDFVGAKYKVEEAIELNPGQPNYTVQLAWVIYSTDQNNQAGIIDAVNLLKKATDEQENLFEAYQYLGQISLNKGDDPGAVKWFKKCLTFDSKNIEAARGLRLINSRGGVPAQEPSSSGKKGKEKGDGGFLGRFLKK